MSCCSRRPVIRASTLASRCCRRVCRCCSGSGSPRRSRPSASPSMARSSFLRRIRARSASISPKAGTRRSATPTRFAARASMPFCCSAPAVSERRSWKAAARARSNSWARMASPCTRSTKTVPASAGGPAISSMPPAVTRCSARGSAPSAVTAITTAQPCMRISAMPGGARTRTAPATSASSGSITAGSGPSRLRTVSPASVRWCGPIT